MDNLKNLGTADRIVRVVLGLALLSLLFVLEGPAKYAGLAGLILLGTAAVGTCPLYLPFGIRTCKVHAPKAGH